MSDCFPFRLSVKYYTATIYQSWRYKQRIVPSTSSWRQGPDAEQSDPIRFPTANFPKLVPSRDSGSSIPKVVSESLFSVSTESKLVRRRSRAFISRDCLKCLNGDACRAHAVAV